MNNIEVEKYEKDIFEVLEHPQGSRKKLTEIAESIKENENILKSSLDAIDKAEPDIVLKQLSQNNTDQSI